MQNIFGELLIKDWKWLLRFYLVSLIFYKLLCDCVTLCAYSRSELESFPPLSVWWSAASKDVQRKKKKTDSIVVKMSFFCCGDIKLLSINNCRHWGGCCPDHICCRSVVNVLMKDTWTCGQVGTESPTLQLTDPARSKSEDKFQLHFAEAPTLHVGEFDGMNHQKWPPVHSSCSGYDL